MSHTNKAGITAIEKELEGSNLVEQRVIKMEEPDEFNPPSAVTQQQVDEHRNETDREHKWTVFGRACADIRRVPGLPYEYTLGRALGVEARKLPCRGCLPLWPEGKDGRKPSFLGFPKACYENHLLDTCDAHFQIPYTRNEVCHVPIDTNYFKCCYLEEPRRSTRGVNKRVEEEEEPKRQARNIRPPRRYQESCETTTTGSIKKATTSKKTGVKRSACTEQKEIGEPSTKIKQVEKHFCPVCSKESSSRTVQCNSCRLWVHFRCGNFVWKKNQKNNTKDFKCPGCRSQN